MTAAGSARVLGLLGAAVLMQGVPVRGQGMEVDAIRREFRTCRADADDTKRLACFDALQRVLEPPSFQGSHSQETPFFTIDRPTLLRYQSDGPIFVMYLQDEKGSVVQNLHIGGGGESSFLITTRGKYNLDVNGTDTWRIWLEPQAAADRAPSNHAPADHAPAERGATDHAAHG